jgi:DNA (cytosine-5)-methyltransferase 1
MTAYYNEIDPYCAQWLRNLIAAGLIAPGDVDERSIEDVRPSDLMGYTQCHFFAGIGVWAYALRRSGWADDRPVWTGSCPCQPFSAAGEGLGFADERHLWPAFHHLIRERKPAVVFGEQVASKDADPWIDLVQTDLEAMGYAVGAVPFPSAGVGAPHIRDRLYWVADARGARLAQRQRITRVSGAAVGADTRKTAERTGVLNAVRLEHAGGFGRERREAAAPGNDDDRTASERAQGEHGIGVTSAHRLPEHSASPTNGHWRVADWLLCRDGKWRPVEPGTFPLAHGAPARVGRLRAYGNAINAEAAIAFITATEEAKLFL